MPDEVPEWCLVAFLALLMVAVSRSDRLRRSGGFVFVFAIWFLAVALPIILRLPFPLKSSVFIAIFFLGLAVFGWTSIHREKLPRRGPIGLMLFFLILGVAEAVLFYRPAHHKEITLANNVITVEDRSSTVTIARQGLEVSVLARKDFSDPMWFFQKGDQRANIASDDLYRDSEGNRLTGPQVGAKIAAWANVQPTISLGSGWRDWSTFAYRGPG